MTAPARILRLSLTAADPERLADFYEEALGFEHMGAEERGGEAARLMGLPGARIRAVRLRIGAQELELLGFTPPGRPYPAARASNDPWFQHFAVVVSDMAAACARLARHGEWTPITRDGPQRLPESSGGVTAFKFRDPEGHPLELLAFPASHAPAAWRARDRADPCLGIDHSAIVVAETARSVDFYERLLGLSVVGRSLNRGEEQERLDDLPGVVAEVAALADPAAPPPHLELLCYRAPASRAAATVAMNDVAATQLVIAVEDLPMLAARLPVPRFAASDHGPSFALLRDPDGHALMLAG